MARKHVGNSPEMIAAQTAYYLEQAYFHAERAESCEHTDHAELWCDAEDALETCERMLEGLALTNDMFN
jgi:hypothetical protein